MKRGTPDHPKVKVFAELIKRRRPEAVGYLELLFHFTAQYAPDGWIGRYDEKRIAAGLDWVGKPSIILDALVKAGWVDDDPAMVARSQADGRPMAGRSPADHWPMGLVVHDWHDHADRATLQKLSRSGKTPVQLAHTVTDKVCAHSETQKNSTRELDAHLPEPVPEPVPEPFSPEPPPLAAVTPVSEQASPDLSDLARSIWCRHPGDKRCTLQAAERALAQIAMDSPDPPLATAERIDDRHAGWVASEEWTKERGRWCPKLLNWLDPVRGGWAADPPEAESDDWDEAIRLSYLIEGKVPPGGVQ